MNKAEFQLAFDVANSSLDLSKYDDWNALNGFALPDFKHATCSIYGIARMIRWQCFQLNGDIDFEALECCRRHFRNKVTPVAVEDARKALNESPIL